jgi:hypothetical protein
MIRRIVAAVAVFTLVVALPVTSWALSVFVISGGDITTDNKVRKVLIQKGHTVTLGPEPLEWDGTQANLASYDVVVLLNNYNWNKAGDMPLEGQDAIVSFVNNGGGLVTGQWVDYLVNSGKYQNLKPIIPTIYQTYNYYTKATYTRGTPNKALNKNLPTSFQFSTNNIGGSEVTLAKKVGAVIYYWSGNTTKVGVAGWRIGTGRVISFSTLLSIKEFKNVNYQTLFANAVRWSSM